jgi:hypothetical protein
MVKYLKASQVAVVGFFNIICYILGIRNAARDEESKV